MSLYADEAELLNTYPKMSSESTGTANGDRHATCLGRSLPKDILLLHVWMNEDMQNYERINEHLKGGKYTTKTDDSLSKTIAQWSFFENESKEHFRVMQLYSFVFCYLVFFAGGSCNQNHWEIEIAPFE